MEAGTLFAFAQKIQQMPYDYLPGKSRNFLSLSDHKDSDVNPLYRQTASGLFLELNFETPNKLWTPWGEWKCWGTSTGNWKDTITPILERLRAVIHLEMDESQRYGDFGPVYAITMVDGILLPPALERPRSKYLPEDVVESAWEELKQSYMQNHK